MIGFYLIAHRLRLNRLLTFKFNTMKPDKSDTKFFNRSRVTRSSSTMEETMKAAEKNLAHRMVLITGFIWFMLLYFNLETTWYGWGLLLAFVAFCVAIVIRWIGELKRGEI